jgi:signal transduction histidine kinase
MNATHAASTVAKPSKADLIALHGERRRWTREVPRAIEAFSQHLLVARVVAVVLAGLLVNGAGTKLSAVGLLGFVGWTSFRWWRPVRSLGALKLGAALSAEVCLAAGAVALTGGWSSPLAPLLVPAIMLVGFAERGLLPAAMAVIASGVITFVWATKGSLTPNEVTTAAQWTFVLVTVTGITNLASQTVDRARRVELSQAASLNSLRDANDLLVKLHRVATQLPDSLDLRDVIDRTVANTRTLVGADVVAILLEDTGVSGWSVAGGDGAYLPTYIESADLPSHLSKAGQTAVAANKASASASLSGIAACSIGVPLQARHRRLGILVVEFIDVPEDLVGVVDVLAQLAGPAGLALDNARWFRSIERTAADDERLRIARDLHDRLGQSVALVGFELDTVRRNVGDADEALTEDLDRVRGQVRNIVTELRETLYDLRTEVTTDRNMIGTVTEFLERVEARSELSVSFGHNVRHDVPPRKERELWLITQEAIVNAERHAQASRIDVRYDVIDNEITVEVADDGRGITGEMRADSYGLKGLRERAASLGARLEITTNGGQGTLVRCRVPRR